MQRRYTVCPDLTLLYCRVGHQWYYRRG